MNWQARPFLGKILLPTEQDTQRLGAHLVPLLNPGDTLLLQGSIGMGKTTLARSFIQTFLDKPISVESPTFNLVHLYDQGPFPLWHVDLYRLEHPQEWLELGLDDTNEGIKLIEWPEKAHQFIQGNPLTLLLTEENEERIATVFGDESWRQKISTIFQEEGLPLS